MTQRMTQRFFEAVKRIKGYQPYVSHHKLNLITKRVWRVWKFHEIPGEYHERMN